MLKVKADLEEKSKTPFSPFLMRAHWQTWGSIPPEFPTSWALGTGRIKSPSASWPGGAQAWAKQTSTPRLPTPCSHPLAHAAQQARQPWSLPSQRAQVTVPNHPMKTAPGSCTIDENPSPGKKNEGSMREGSGSSGPPLSPPPPFSLPAGHKQPEPSFTHKHGWARGQ